ncbi:3'-5' exonuclease domain-containing protein [Pleurotus pulmonarius]
MKSVLKDSGSLAARCRVPSPPRTQNRCRVPSGPQELQPTRTQSTASHDDNDSEIEVFGPFEIEDPLPKTSVPKSRKRRATGAESHGAFDSNVLRVAGSATHAENLHPFFTRNLKIPSVKSRPLTTLVDSMQGLSLEGGSLPSGRPTSATLASSSLPAQLMPHSIVPSKKPEAQPEEDTEDQHEFYSYKLYEPAPARVYVTNEDEANDLVGMLRGPIGFDMEWRVFYTRSSSGPVKVTTCRTATVQVCDERMILVIQVHRMKRFPQKLKELIESKTIVKMGANILNDGAKLFSDYGVVGQNLVELGALARQADPDAAKLFITKRGTVRNSTAGIASLAKVVAKYCGKVLEKPKERTSNWEASLTERQLTYAANDAHSALMAYLKILEIAKQHDRTLTPSAYTRHVSSALSGLPSEDEELDDEEASQGTDKGTEKHSIVPSVDTKATKTDVAPVIIPLTHTGMRSQYWRAYRMWHGKGTSLEDMCKTLSIEGPPLKRTTVISYVIGALQADTTLPFDMRKLREIVQTETKSWSYYKPWLLQVGREGRGVAGATAAKREQ